MITYMVESWFDVKDEMSSLWPLHYEEIATNKDKIKLSPDFDTYANYAKTGALHVMVVRETGKIIGYHISIIRNHMHYKESLNAFTDVYYVSKEHRRGNIGTKLFMETEKSLKERGVEKIFTGTKVSLNMSVLFNRLGYAQTEILFTKYIG